MGGLTRNVGPQGFDRVGDSDRHVKLVRQASWERAYINRGRSWLWKVQISIAERREDSSGWSHERGRHISFLGIPEYSTYFRDLTSRRSFRYTD